MEKHITLPLTEETARSLHAGDTVYLTERSIPPETLAIRECARRWRGEKNFPLIP